VTAIWVSMAAALAAFAAGLFGLWLQRLLPKPLEGAFWGTQAAARQMIAQGEGGVIVNMSSINSGLANPRVATYAITKGGMNQITGHRRRRLCAQRYPRGWSWARHDRYRNGQGRIRL
jgi:NAD(P)-dependent dehydrogenase (short-subunit alcohol dehydrogenase family)